MQRIRDGRKHSTPRGLRVVQEHEITVCQEKKSKLGSPRDGKGEGSRKIMGIFHLRVMGQGKFPGSRVVTDSSFRKISLVTYKEGAKGSKIR